MIFLPKFDPELIIKLMARATVLMGVPTFYTRLLQSPSLDEGMRPSTCGCSFRAPRRCSPTPTANGPRAPASRILERYGMTETNMNTSNPL
jgi:malonyl-CoA/methylmalonyl-CoA synthetase